MSSDPDVRKAAAAARSLARLNAQAGALRAELVRLRRTLADAQQEFRATRGAQLLEANEQLVLAALRAEATAETAVSDMGELTRSSQRDALTDTPNRDLMLDRLESAIAMARRRGTRVAVLFVDLDRFKEINDSLGHAVGDEVLQLAARRLESVVRDSDTVSRHGGDEFLVLLFEISQAADAAPIAAKMLSALAAPARVGEHVLRLSASMGIAVYPEDGEDAETLISRADVAMYRSKRRGRGCFEFHAEATAGGRSLEPTGAEYLQQPGTRREDAPGEQEPRLRDLREANEQLVIAALTAQELEEHAAEAHRRQIKFLAMVAHELRNPLAPIRTAVELLDRAGTDDPSIVQLQVTIRRQVAHMARLVDDLLDESRQARSRFRLDRVKVDLAGILGRAVEACKPLIDARLQHLKVQLPERPLIVHGDPVRLAQVFHNLLDNASKFTPEGGEIALTAVLRGEAIAISVADNGIGITAKALPDIFDRFAPDAHAHALNNRRLGIGLAVVRDLVDAHGGNVVGRSAGRNRGSEFVVTLPMADGPADSTA